MKLQRKRILTSLLKNTVDNVQKKCKIWNFPEHALGK